MQVYESWVLFTWGHWQLLISRVKQQKLGGFNPVKNICFNLL